jgi:hypothetical protein
MSLSTIQEVERAISELKPQELEELLVRVVSPVSLSIRCALRRALNKSFWRFVLSGKGRVSVPGGVGNNGVYAARSFTKRAELDSLA